MTRGRQKAAPQYRQRLRRWDVDIALERYLVRWQRAREGRIEKAIADVLGHAREHDAADFYGVDHTTAPSLLGSWQSSSLPAFSFDTFREAILRIVGMPQLPPFRPWLPRHRVDELVASGIKRSLIEMVFATSD